METLRESDSEEPVQHGETKEEDSKEEQEDFKKEEEDGDQAELEGLNKEKTNTLCPESYKANCPKEIRMLNIADNFQQQFSHLYPERKPLLLCPVNECGVKKFVSTSIAPASTNHPELFTWEGCANFVANFLSLVPLEPPEDLPRMLFSSTSVLQSQRATCFEFASLLCSLLNGADYDAYCVSGYAVKEICLLDQRLQECPLLATPVKNVISEQELQENKYTLDHQWEPKSIFLLQQEKKKQDAKDVLLEQQNLQETEQGPPDILRGLRRHCWVLVLSGSRSVQENFFIDPLTGNSYSTNHDYFLGIDSVWNNLNYYVNMQDCSNGCATMVYDLEDLNLWEPVLFGATSRKQLILEVLNRKEAKRMMIISNDEGEEEMAQAFEMPRSWVSWINISKKDMENCWPGKKKTTLYKKAKLERFATYLRTDGLITRLTTYKDLEYTEAVSRKEWYQHREDHLQEKEVNLTDNVTTELFKHGRRFHLLFHKYTNTEHEMEFSNDRADHLVRRMELPGEMTEFFEGREDLLYYRHAVFDTDNQQLQKVEERYHRNKSKPAHEDVAERVFFCPQRRIEMMYHSENLRVIPSKRSIIIPRESTGLRKAEDFTADMVSSFQVDPTETPLTLLEMYEIMKTLKNDQEEMVLEVRQSKQEVKNIVACRRQEEENIGLVFSPWTKTGVARVRSQRLEMERRAAEKQQWLREKEDDILAPFLIQLNNPNNLSPKEAIKLHKDCLDSFQQRLVEQANLIQERYEKETQALRRKQQWYQKNQLTMTENQEEEYQSYCAEKTLQIQVAKKRLKIHKITAAQKYSVLDKKLKDDPRLAPFLES